MLFYQNQFFLFWWLLGLFAPPWHIDTLFLVQVLYREPCTRPYEIRIYRHRSSLRAVTAGGSGLQDPQQLWGRSAL